jgi:hypothetical protein
LQFEDGDSIESLGLIGFETFSVTGLSAGITPRQSASVTATRADGSGVQFKTTVRIDAPGEVEYFLNGGILQMVALAFVDVSRRSHCNDGAWNEAPTASLIRPHGSLFQVTSEPVPHRAQHLVGKIGLAARAETLEERSTEDGNRHGFVDGGRDRPPSFA